MSSNLCPPSASAARETRDGVSHVTQSSPCPLSSAPIPAMPYRLSASLHAHSSDVRGVASPSSSLVLSVSRDKTAIAWTRLDSSVVFSPDATFQAGSNYVNCVTYIQPTPVAPKGYLVAGGTDTVINVYDLSSNAEEPKYSLLGHTENVCALHALPSGLIISGSWDRTAKVWVNFQEAYELKGHKHSVWAVLAVNDEQFLTGSADNTIKVWQGHKCIRTVTGHTSAVRGLALIPDIGFASCSNDSEVRLWTSEGDLVHSLSGHTSFVYSLAVLPDGDIVSAGEDRTVRLWHDGECSQTIVHPAISVWSVSAMPNGDIITGASDGVVRVFSASEERWAPIDELKQYDETIAQQALPSELVGDVKKTDLPGPEALSQPGNQPGEVKMIRANDNIEAHQWDSATNSWQKIGEVVDAVGSGRRQLYEGKEYDYVFDVDIQDGVPPLKLPFNTTENPFAAAQRFLLANGLPLSYIDQVVAFIEKNTKGVTLSANEGPSDPFTGGSRYRSGPTSVPTGGSASYSDPFTGGARYTPSGGPPMSTNMSQSLPPPASAVTIFPLRTFLSFKQANVPAMRGKIMQYDEAFQNEISTSSLAMYPDESSSLEETLTFLSKATMSGGAALQTSPLNESHLETIVQILERWPSSSRFPVIDVARLVSGYCPSCFAEPAHASNFFSSVLKAAEWSDPWEVPVPKSRETNVMLALRAVANAFQESTRCDNVDWAAKVLEEISKAPYDALNKNNRIAMASLVFNLSCVRLKGPISSQTSDWHLALLIMVLKERTDAEAAYRALVSLGNTLYALESQNSTFTPGHVSELRESAMLLAKQFPEDRIVKVVRELERSL